MVALGWLFDVGPMLAKSWSIVSIITDKCWLLIGWLFDVGPMLVERWSIVSFITENVGFWLAIRRWANVGSLSPFSLINGGY